MKGNVDVSLVYGICLAISLLVLLGYCFLIKKKLKCHTFLYVSVVVANLGYFLLSLADSLNDALFANRLAYLGCVFMPFFMMLSILKVCNITISKKMAAVILSISFVIYAIVASQGYAGWYYKEVLFEVVDGTAKLVKVYGPLHKVYYVYLFSYLALMIGVIAYAIIKKKVIAGKQAMLLSIVVVLNVVIWLVEQLIEWEFEFLSVSYVVSELLLLLLYGVVQDYEALVEAHRKDSLKMAKQEMDYEKAVAGVRETGKLSSRELEVLRLMIADKKRREIAEELFITENTVKKHITNIFAKLEVNSREELYDKMLMNRK